MSASAVRMTGDTDMNRGFEIPKAAPETAAAGIFEVLKRKRRSFLSVANYKIGLNSVIF